MSTPRPDQVLAAARALLNRGIFVSEVSDAREPAVVVATDPETGTKQAYGIYEDSFAAAADLGRITSDWARDIGEPLPKLQVITFFSLE